MNPSWLRQYDPNVPRTLSYPDATLPRLLEEAAVRHGHRPAVRYYGATLTYRRLNDLTSRFADALCTMRGVPGGKVALMLPNVPQSVIGYFGALKAGAAVSPINPLYVEHEIERQISDAGCDTIVALRQFYPRIGPLLGRTCLKHVILTGPEDYLPRLKRLLFPFVQRGQRPRVDVPGHPAVHSFRRLVSQGRPRASTYGAPDDVALLQYTGGTTGIPKGVVLTHRNLVANTWQCRHWMPSLQEGDETFLSVLPFFHVYGMSACQNLAISIGGAMVLLPRFQVGEVLETIEKERITVFPGIPAMYAAINGHQRLERYNLRSIRLCISGAGALPQDVQTRFEALTGARLVEGYGLTEASPVTHVNPIESKGRPRSIGLPLPDTDAKLVDAEHADRELPVGQVGELVIRGPQVMQGYWNRPDDTAQVLKDGWLYTGDLARMDEDGFFYIEDRKKDMIKSGGENVYPREVEEVLARHPKVKEAVVVGLPQDLRGELIKAYVVVQEGQNVTAAELLDHCRGQLAKFKVPRKVEFRSALPKTVIGKVLRRVLIEEELNKRRSTAP